MNSDLYDTTPLPAMLRGMQSQPWSVSGALSELVDNSFGPGRGDARSCHITYDTKARTFTVLDNGRGMTAIGRLFQLGSAAVRAPGDIGNYGYGGSYGILWLARRVEIWTLVNNRVQYDSVSWPEVFNASTFPLVSNQWAHATASNTPAALFNESHGTLIKLHLLNERKVSTNNVQRDLAATYAPAARMARELVWTTIGKNGETRNLGDAIIAFPDPSKVITFNLTVHTPDGDDLPVEGMVGIVDGLPFEKSAVSIGFGPRVIIKTKDCFVSEDRQERFSGSGVTGWLDLGEGWQPYLTTTKDGLNDQPVWDRLMGFVFDKIRPLLEMVEMTRLELELDNIALNLERVLGGIARVEVAGHEKRQSGPRDPGGVSHGSTGNGQPRKPKAFEPIDEDGTDTTEPGSTRILIIPQTDEQMRGQLVAAVEVGDGIEAAVNIDHPVLKEALRQRPVNRMMLNYGVTREIAEVIDASQLLSDRVFTPAQQRILEEFEGRKPRLIHRWLMDAAKEIA